MSWSATPEAAANATANWNQPLNTFEGIRSFNLLAGAPLDATIVMFRIKFATGRPSS